MAHYYHKTHKLWYSRISKDGKLIHLGYFKTEEEAKEKFLIEKKKINDSRLPLDTENYRDIVGYDGLYKISEDGKIISFKCDIVKEIIPAKNQKGYLTCTLLKDGKNKSYLVHRLIFIAFNGAIPENMVVDHIDRNPLNNNISNLRAIRQSDNIRNSTRVDNAKGCYFDKRVKKWLASIRINKKLKFLGLFDTEEEAHNAYIEERNKIGI